MAHSKAILKRRQMGNRHLFLLIEIRWKMAFKEEIYVNFH